jgi:hypothetical protein
MNAVAGRPLPWTGLVAAIGDARLGEIRADLEARGTADLDRDAFLLNGTVGALLRELVPADAPAEAVTGYGALLHAIYCCWARDWPVAALDADTLRASLLAARASPLTVRAALACYVQLPQRLVWAEPAPGTPHEPLDGVFLLVHGDRALALAVLGFHELREGFTTMAGDLRLPAPAPSSRADGSASFASILPGGDLAKLRSVVDTHELVALALIALGAAETA